MMESLHDSADAPAPDLSTSPVTPASCQRPANDSDLRSGAVSVLLVDDDPETARGVKRSLLSHGLHVETQTSAVMALEALRERPFDVVISDICMPDMDGFGLLGAVRRIDANVPVVLLTGDPTVSSAARALEVGAFRYVTKPPDSAGLAAVAEKAARLYRMSLVKAQAAELLGREAQTTQDHEGLNLSFDRCMSSLWVAFQPIVDVPKRRIFGFEALMRSKEPDLPHPGAVLEAAEQLARLDELGRIVRCRAAQAMPRAPEDVAFFINLHVRDLLDDTLLSDTSPLAPHASRVVLEVTERASLAEVPDVKQRISALREIGYRIAVDDLGAGYAGLTSFALLEPEFVKLDMSLVRDIHLSKTKTKVVRSMVNLAQDMGMLVVGEGIECAEEADALVELGCDFLQGFFYARPGEPFVEVTF